MKTFKLIALTATLLIGASAAYASPFDAMDGTMALDALSDAHYATVLTATEAEARTLAFDNDVAALQSRVQNNKYLVNQLSAQGFSSTDVVGIEGTGSDVTLYVL